MSNVTPRKLLIYCLVAVLLIGQAKLWFGDYGVLKLSALKRDLAAQQDENQELIERNEALNAQVNELKNHKEALEERARSQLGLIKEGEIFIQEELQSAK